MKLIDITGQKFNSLEVLERVPQTSPVQWKCRCDCGKIVNVRGSYLRNGHTKSCGCERIKAGHNQGSKNIKDLTGQKFGFLTVIKDSGERKNHNVVWLCQCECGNTSKVLTTNLKNGSTLSCGCIKKSFGETKIESILKENNIQYISEFCVSELNNARFDFALLKSGKIIRIIEFDGEHHYEEVSFHKNNCYTLKDRQERDQKKNDWAAANNIPLVRIPYWEKENITLEMLMDSKYEVK